MSDLIERMVAIAWREDTTGLAADALREGSERIAEAAARIRVLEEALEAAETFIRKEYADPSREPEGDWLDADARPIHDLICKARWS